MDRNKRGMDRECEGDNGHIKKVSSIRDARAALDVFIREL